MSRALWLVLGRRNFVRLARFLTLESRLDAEQDIDSDGEMTVLRVVLEGARTDRSCVILDVGANVGDWSLAVLQTARELDVRCLSLHAFEPSAATRAILERRIAAGGANASVTLSPLALSNERRLLPLYVTADEAGTNSLYSMEDLPPPLRVETVPVDTVDGYCAAQGIARIELLKCDVEGHDMAVIEGSRGMLERGAIGVIQFEYNFRWIYARKYLRDAFEFLAPLGYRIGKVTPRGLEFYPSWHFELETFRQGNYLACTPEWAARFPSIAWWNTAPSRPAP